MDAITPTNVVDTNVVVIMYGWVGSTPRNLKKYASMYSSSCCETRQSSRKANGENNKSNNGSNVAVVYGTAGTHRVITRRLDANVLDSVRKAVEIIRNAESARETSHNNGEVTIPIVLHYFSNGGAFMAETLDRMIKDATSGHMKDKKDSEDLTFLSKRLKTKGYEVLDSAPVYLHDDVAYKVMDASVSNLPLRVVLKGLVFLTSSTLKISSWICREVRTDVLFWNNMLESDLCQRQVVVYSTIDKLTDPKKVEEFIVERNERGIDVTVVKFDDTDHVLHMKDHPIEYQEGVVDYVLAGL